MNHVICIPLFGKKESQELILESWNQAKIPKDSESRRRKFPVADPSSLLNLKLDFRIQFLLYLAMSYVSLKKVLL